MIPSPEDPLFDVVVEERVLVQYVIRASSLERARALALEHEREPTAGALDVGLELRHEYDIRGAEILTVAPNGRAEVLR